MATPTVLFVALLALTARAELFNMRTADLIDLIEKDDYEQIYAQICPEIPRGSTCKGKFDKEYEEAGGKQAPVVIPFSDNKDHTNFIYPGGFFLKSFLVSEDELLPYAVNEINLGLKVKDSIAANNIHNLAPALDCCMQRVQSGFERKPQFFIKFPNYPLGSLRKFVDNPANAKIVTSITWRFITTLGILGGIEVLHSRQFGHRDLKPDNVLMAHICEPILTDYGFNKKILTTTDTIGGTPIFMPPEVANGDSYDVKVDIWSAGALMYYIAAPRPFAWTEDWWNQAQNVCTGKTIRLNKTSWPLFTYCTFFDEPVRKALNKDITQRPSASDLLNLVRANLIDFLKLGDDYFVGMDDELTKIGCGDNKEANDILDRAREFFGEWTVTMQKGDLTVAMMKLNRIRPDLIEPDGKIVKGMENDTAEYIKWILEMGRRWNESQARLKAEAEARAKAKKQHLIV